MVVLNGPAALRARVGEDLGTSEWVQVTQRDIDGFADLTGDHQWIHVDRVRAAASPFGGTIAHGYLTLALAPRLLDDVVSIEGFEFGVNYGLDRVRFPAPLPAESRVRVHARLADVAEVQGGVQVKLDLSFEREGAEKPVCVASWLGRYVSR
jgi:acyl dehydratase